ncbi:transcriptional repressor [Roseiconus nitratireducens]|uniref:Transcriptional repressor n=1 Tax=Roseiconus nitratireducens TaxID=2605748 RepID=A0A5M6DBA4_9BACT|nr:transcriptional repressor [Roseiconus nitratireducens]KAA5544653.1 transcriptional repressor [Roseiconus nitratireducens]
MDAEPKRDAALSLEEVRDDIRRSGLRATPARVATLRLLRQSSSPLTHATVAESLADSGIDQATVFRNLNDLAESGLLRRTELGDHVWRFEAIRPGADDQSAHPHFLCVDCGAVRCLGDVRLTAGSLRNSSRVGEITEILLRGRCNDCLL